jgi:hypothetical protein
MLMERDHADHGDFDQLLPRVGCNVCHRAVQTVPADWARARAAYQVQDTDDEDALQERVRFEGPMAAWSHEHARTHSDEKHQDAEQRLKA